MLDALELFQYSYAFRDSLFVILLSDLGSMTSLLTDIQLIQSAQIYLMVLVPHSENLEKDILSIKKSGLPLEYLNHNTEHPVSRSKLCKIRKEFNSHDVVVVSLKHPPEENLEEHHIEDAIEIANLFSARKLFYIHKDGALFIDDKPIFHISLQNLSELLNSPTSSCNIESKLLSHFAKDVKESKREIAILDDTPGALFQEIFTHQGRGTLITTEYPNAIRSGERKDVFMVSRIIKPYVERGILLNIPENELKKCINDFLLYTINDAIVAGARMKTYGTYAELASFFCLPRFRRRGHARVLAIKFIELAKQKGLSHVFSLSVTEGMWSFFESLGFEQIERDLLPDEWKKSYNMNRSSKAFILKT